MLTLGRIAFIGLLLLLGFVGTASLVGHPGPLVVCAFSAGGLIGWAFNRDRQWLGSLVISLLTVAAIMMLLTTYSDDGVSALIIQCCVLGLLAYGLAWGGIEASRSILRPRDHLS